MEARRETAAEEAVVHCQVPGFLGGVHQPSEPCVCRHGERQDLALVKPGTKDDAFHISNTGDTLKKYKTWF